MKVFIDANIVLDLLFQRRGYVKDAEKIFSLADRGKIKLYISALSFGIITYFINKNHHKNDAKSILKELQEMVEVLPFTQTIINLTLNSYFDDIEDGYQYFTAKENHLSTIITRNKKDFKSTDINVSTPKEFLEKTLKT